MKFKAAIFDLDGLLIDSEPLWEKIAEIFLKKRNLVDTLPISETRGRGVREIIALWKEKIGLVGENNKLMQEYRNFFYSQAKNELELMPGAETLLVHLHKLGIPLAVASAGHQRDKIIEMLDDIGLSNYFDIIVSSDDVKIGKPAPDTYLETARQLNIAPQHCLAFEDSINGVKSGVSAGMEVYGINSDAKFRDQLKKAGASEVYASLEEILL